MKNLLIFLCVVLTGHSHAQEIEFGEISLKELEETFYPTDSSAHAAILYKKRDTYYQVVGSTPTLNTTYFYRIKFYDDHDLEFAEKTVDLYRNNALKEIIRKLKGVTYNLVDGQLVKSKMGDSQVFETTYNKNYNKVKFSLPNVKKGSVIDYSYEIQSPFLWNIDDFTFQEAIPIKHIQASMVSPNGMKFNKFQKGFMTINFKQISKKDHRVGMDSNFSLFELKDVPALKDEIYVDDMGNYRAGIIFELVSFSSPSSFESFAQTWEDVAKTVSEKSDYSKSLSKSEYYEEELSLVLQGKSKPIDKVDAVFEFIKQRIKWNGYYGKYFYNGMKKAMKEREGNVADINLTLISMLKYAGINVSPVLISTKDNNIPLFPTLDRLNYVIALVEIEGENYFLDATDEFCDINILPIRVYNWQGLVVSDQQPNWRLIAIKQPNKAISQHYLSVQIDEFGELKGKMKSRYLNHKAKHIREIYKAYSFDEFVINKEKEFNNVEISNYNSDNIENIKGVLSESYDVYSSDAIEFIGEELYLYPMLFLKHGANPFTSEKREFPIDFGYPFKNSYTVAIDLPFKYKIVHQPKSISFKLHDNIGSFRYFLSFNETKINVNVDFQISKSYISQLDYDELKEFFNQMIIKENEQLVIKKL